MTTVRLGTRRSRLATTQSGWVADLLRAQGHDVEIVEIVTEGDTNAAPLTQIGGTGVFATAIRQALHVGRIDIAVHSLKDLPVAPEPGLVVAGIPTREDPRDALVGARLADLAPGARVGTGSPRRAAQLATARADLDIVAIRGNVDSRIARVGADLDAVVLAASGLARLGRLGEAAEVLPADVMLPAPGQGALGVECRADAPGALAAVAELDDELTRAAVTAERALLATLEAGCTAPIGALATLDTAGSRLVLRAFVGTEAGKADLRDELHGPPAEAAEVGAELGRRLLAAGAARLIGVTANAASHEHPARPQARPAAATSNVPQPEPPQESST